MELRDLIRQYPELGDVFADFETRLLRMENSLPYAPNLDVKPKPNLKSKPELWVKRLWNKFNRIEASLKHVRKTVYQNEAAQKQFKETVLKILREGTKGG